MSAAKNDYGGKRKSAGRKTLPKGEQKKILTVYIEQDFIDELGGQKKLQKDIKEYIYQRIIVRHHKGTK